MKKKTNIRLFIDATISVSYIYYGDGQSKSIEINGLFSFEENDIERLDEVLIKRFVDFKHKGHKYDSNSLNVNCKIHYRAINSI